MKPVKLPKSPKDVPPYTKCQVIGWGYTDQKLKTPSDVLRGVDVAIIDRDYCNCLYNRSPVITADMLCAGNKKPLHDSCTVCIKYSKESTISGY